jgi:hypothetical protein
MSKFLSLFKSQKAISVDMERLFLVIMTFKTSRASEFMTTYLNFRYDERDFAIEESFSLQQQFHVKFRVKKDAVYFARVLDDAELLDKMECSFEVFVFLHL